MPASRSSRVASALGCMLLLAVACGSERGSRSGVPGKDRGESGGQDGAVCAAGCMDAGSDASAPGGGRDAGQLHDAGRTQDAADVHDSGNTNDAGGRDDAGIRENAAMFSIEGGTLIAHGGTIEGARLDVPDGALKAPATLRVHPGVRLQPHGTTVIGPAVRFGYALLVAPVSITLPLDTVPDDTSRVAVLVGDDLYDPFLSLLLNPVVDHDAKTVTVETLWLENVQPVVVTALDPSYVLYDHSLLYDVQTIKVAFAIHGEATPGIAFVGTMVLSAEGAPDVSLDPTTQQDPSQFFVRADLPASLPAGSYKLTVRGTIDVGSTSLPVNVRWAFTFAPNTEPDAG